MFDEALLRVGAPFERLLQVLTAALTGLAGGVMHIGIQAVHIANVLLMAERGCHA